jgi:hypothetical protein
VSPGVWGFPHPHSNEGISVLCTRSELNNAPSETSQMLGPLILRMLVTVEPLDGWEHPSCTVVVQKIPLCPYRNKSRICQNFGRPPLLPI